MISNLADHVIEAYTRGEIQKDTVLLILWVANRSKAAGCAIKLSWNMVAKAVKIRKARVGAVLKEAVERGFLVDAGGSTYTLHTQYRPMMVTSFQSHAFPTTPSERSGGKEFERTLQPGEEIPDGADIVIDGVKRGEQGSFKKSKLWQIEQAEKRAREAKERGE